MLDFDSWPVPTLAASHSALRRKKIFLGFKSVMQSFSMGSYFKYSTTRGLNTINIYSIIVLFAFGNIILQIILMIVIRRFYNRFSSDLKP